MKLTLDHGLLIDTFADTEVEGPLLDVGCGYGPIGLSLAKSFPDRIVHMVDVNERALGLGERECGQQRDFKCVLSMKVSCLNNVSEKKFSCYSYQSSYPCRKRGCA